MGDCHVECKKPALMEPHPFLKRPTNGVPQRDLDFSSKSNNASRCNANQTMKPEKRDGGGYSSGVPNERIGRGKLDGIADTSPPNSSNQNGVLYVGAGRVSGLSSGNGGGSHRRTKSMSMVYNGSFDSSEVSPEGMNASVRGSFRSTKSSESDPSTLRNLGSADAIRGSQKVADNGHIDVGAVNPPASDFGKVIKENNVVPNGVLGNNVMGIGNIVGRGAINPKSSSSSSSQGSVSSNGSKNSGEFSGGRAPRHSRALSMGGIGQLNCGSSFNPPTVGDFARTGCSTISKGSTNSFPKSSADVSTGNIKGSNGTFRADDSNLIGRTNSGINLPRGGRTTFTGSINGVCANGTSSNLSNKANGRVECPIGSMGNILNSGHVRSNSYGSVSDFGNISKVMPKDAQKNDAQKNGFDAHDSEHLGDATLIKKGFSSTNPEEVKNIGNEFYKKRSFAEALSLYEKAISLCPGQASYRSNKAAALSGLGRLPEAVYECEEALKLDPSYMRAHQRVASLYLRLGLVESSKSHFQAAGQPSNSGELQRVEQVKRHVSRCIEMRRAANWMLVVKECAAAIAAGADSAPQVFGYKAEALLKLQKPDEADAILSSALKTDVALAKFGVTPLDSFLYVVRANVDMALGRFEEAVASSESAARIDPRKMEVTTLLRKARAVSYARRTGNELFKARKFMEACIAYGEGLESDPTNPVLLCNRAACRSKLGQWEKAFEDCNAALNVQPNYTKALMRRADCNAKLERWQDALNDYEALQKEIPGEADVARGIHEAQVALDKCQAEEGFKMKFTGDMGEVSSKEQFREVVAFPGLVIVQFVARWNDQCRQISPFMNRLCKRYPSVNFFKVDVEENPSLAKLENVISVPTLRIYKNGTKLKEMLAPSEEMLENTMQQLHL